MALSNAIDASALASVVGYALGFKNFSTASKSLPQRISIFSVIQGSLQVGFNDWDKRHTMSSVQEVLDLFGICPAYYVMRILKPVSGGGVGSIPIDVYPIQEGTGITSGGQLTVTGTATKTVEHVVKFNGREFIDGQSARYVVESGDINSAIAVKMVNAINGVFNSSVVASDGGSGIVDFSSKFTTIVANEIGLLVDTKQDAAGIVYTVPTFLGGSGTVDISGALAEIGDIWTTGLINTFDSSIFDIFSDFNGIPNPNTGGTGRWNAKTVKPCVAMTGTVESVKATLQAFSAGRKDDLTNIIAPSPNSPGFTFESAANLMGAFMTVMNSRPHATASNVYYLDMPGPADNDIGDMKSYDVRDELVKEGISTVTFDESLGYRIEDIVTFRRLDSQGLLSKDWRYARDIVGIDFNVAYNYRIIEQIYLVHKTIMGDDDVIDSTVSADIIKPKDWKALVSTLFTKLSKKGLITNVSFSDESLQVAISGTNSNRIDTVYNYKRTGTARISSTTAYAGFSFGV